MTAQKLLKIQSVLQNRMQLRLKEPFLGHAAYNHYSSYYANPLVSDRKQTKDVIVLSLDNSVVPTVCMLQNNTNCTF